MEGGGQVYVYVVWDVVMCWRQIGRRIECQKDSL